MSKFIPDPIIDKQIHKMLSTYKDRITTRSLSNIIEKNKIPEKDTMFLAYILKQPIARFAFSQNHESENDVTKKLQKYNFLGQLQKIYHAQGTTAENKLEAIKEIKTKYPLWNVATRPSKLKKLTKMISDHLLKLCTSEAKSSTVKAVSISKNMHTLLSSTPKDLTDREAAAENGKSSDETKGSTDKTFPVEMTSFLLDL